MTADFKKLGVIAGAGELPARIASGVVAEGRSVFVARLSGIADADFNAFEGVEVRISEVGKLLGALKTAGCDAVTLAGVVRRPNFSALRPDLKGAKLLPRIVASARRGDDALLGTLVQVFEEEGFAVLGAEEAAGDLRAPAGPVGAVSPLPEHFADLRLAAGVVDALGPFDVGQGAVVCDGLVLAVEAQEGTDAMLSRCAGLPSEVRGSSVARRGVLAKLPKPEQERRVDLPTIGVPTVNRASAAGLAGVFVLAGEALVVNRKAVVAAADAAGLFVYGFTPEELAPPAEDVEAEA
ncbi:MAG: UDP-2,3-diacylglucosamine diphosphatase LpxI [Pseudomonadota bacterium]